MKYAYKVVDRRDAYYSRAAQVIATDSLSFYARAERGRTLQLGLFTGHYERQAMGTAEPVSQEDYDHANS